MTNTEKFNDTVGILVKAYLNGTLAHGSCTACAVGNLIAHHLGTEPDPDKENVRTGFHNDIYKNGVYQSWYNYVWNEKKIRASQQTDLTGYSVDQLIQIEFAFESTEGPDCRYGPTEYIEKFGKPIGLDDEWMFTGLMKVVNVLAEIHNIDLEQTKKARELFVK